jgi:hypothetical protein
MSRLIALVMFLAVALSTTACIIEDPGPGPGRGGWCFWHPYRCR